MQILSWPVWAAERPGGSGGSWHRRPTGIGGRWAVRGAAGRPRAWREVQQQPQSWPPPPRRPTAPHPSLQRGHCKCLRTWSDVRTPAGGGGRLLCKKRPARWVQPQVQAGKPRPCCARTSRRRRGSGRGVLPRRCALPRRDPAGTARSPEVGAPSGAGAKAPCACAPPA